MKSYILGPIASPEEAAKTLTELLSAQIPNWPSDDFPWVLPAPAGDAMAYFYLSDLDTPGTFSLFADISGRHYHCDAQIVAILEKLKARIGGEIIYAP